MTQGDLSDPKTPVKAKRVPIYSKPGKRRQKKSTKENESFFCSPLGGVASTSDSAGPSDVTSTVAEENDILRERLLEERLFEERRRRQAVLEKRIILVESDPESPMIKTVANDGESANGGLEEDNSGWPPARPKKKCRVLVTVRGFG